MQLSQVKRAGNVKTIRSSGLMGAIQNDNSIGLDERDVSPRSPMASALGELSIITESLVGEIIMLEDLLSPVLSENYSDPESAEKNPVSAPQSPLVQEILTRIGVCSSALRRVRRIKERLEL